MQGCNQGVNRTKLIMLMVFLLPTGALNAENVLSLKRTAPNSISLELSNEDAIAGFQFSINTRGGISMESFVSSARLVAAGISVFQHAENDSTLNVVLLAPVRSALSRGTGAIGTIQFTTGKTPTADTIRVFLTRIAVCNALAQMLDISDRQLVWREAEHPTAADIVRLEQNFPNPFNPSTTITYTLEHDARVRLAVYDIAGREVALLVDEQQSAGRHSVQWNVLKSGRIALSSGLYFAQLTAGGSSAVGKMVLAK